MRQGGIPSGTGGVCPRSADLDPGLEWIEIVLGDLAGQLTECNGGPEPACGLGVKAPATGEHCRAEALPTPSGERRGTDLPDGLARAIDAVQRRVPGLILSPQRTIQDRVARVLDELERRLTDLTDPGSDASTAGTSE